MSVLLWTALPGAAAAFSDPLAYTDPVDFGGGAGRWFTGSPADGHGCDVCHTGGEPTDLAISGLPEGGYQPGVDYEIIVQWPGAENMALIAELADEQRLAAGTLTLPQGAAMRPEELCAGEQAGFPASEPHPDDTGRVLVSVVDCGARSLRMRWTAPVVDVGRVWFSLGFVHSDVSGDPSGDGVTMVKLPMMMAGAGGVGRELLQGCSVGPRSLGGNRASGSSLWGLLGVVGTGLVVRARRARKGDHGEAA